MFKLNVSGFHADSSNRFPPLSMRNICVDRTFSAIHRSAFAPCRFSCFHLQSNIRRCSLTHTCVRPEGDFTWGFPVFVRDMTISPLLGQWRKHSEKCRDLNSIYSGRRVTYFFSPYLIGITKKFFLFVI